MKYAFAIEMATADGFLVGNRSSTDWWEAGCKTAQRRLKKAEAASMARISGWTNGKFFCREFHKQPDGTITTFRTDKHGETT